MNVGTIDLYYTPHATTYCLTPSMQSARNKSTINNKICTSPCMLNGTSLNDYPSIYGLHYAVATLVVLKCSKMVAGSGPQCAYSRRPQILTTS